MRYFVLCFMLLVFDAYAVEISSRTGTAYDMQTSEMLYTQTHTEHYEDGNIIRDEVIYRDAEGKIFATKELDYKQSPVMPEFHLRNTATGHEEKVTRNADGTIEVLFRETRDLRRGHAPVPLPALGIIDAGFDNFILQYWDRLLADEILSLPLLVPSRFGFVDFRIRKIMQDAQQVFFAVGPDSILLRLWVSEIKVAYDAADRRLRLYEGISNLRDAAGENFRVRIEYP